MTEKKNGLTTEQRSITVTHKFDYALRQRNEGERNSFSSLAKIYNTERSFMTRKRSKFLKRFDVAEACIEQSAHVILLP